jgi:L-ascorbate metabolism protein UlaG (beta-lactamase superfamily)
MFSSWQQTLSIYLKTSMLTEVYRDDATIVLAFRVPHGPVDAAVGYRIEHAGMSVVISGDTEMSRQS